MVYNAFTIFISFFVRTWLINQCPKGRIYSNSKFCVH